MKCAGLNAATPRGLELSQKQARAAVYDRHVSVRAGAGSGKTKTIIEKILGIILDGYENINRGLSCGAVSSGVSCNDAQAGVEILKSVLCITFTNKAAAELVERLRVRLEDEADKTDCEKLRNYLDGVMQRINLLEISTLDSFFTSILKCHSFELGLSPGFTPAPAGRADILFRTAVFNALDALAGGAYKFASSTAGFNIFDDFYSFYKRKARIHNLFARILSKSVYLDTPLFKYKTVEDFRAHIFQRTAALESAARDIEMKALAVSESLAEAIEILRCESASMGGESKKKASALIDFYDRAASGAGKFEEFFECLAVEFRNVRFPAGSSGAGEKFKTLIAPAKKSAAAFLGVKTCAADPAAFELSDVEFDFFKGMCDIFDICRKEYERLKKDENLLDFNDIEEIALEAAGRENIKNALATRYSHILIDEFQDTNGLQARIIDMIKGGARLTIVGDGMQSIYRFRNANCALFSSFESHIANDGGLNVNLDDNYRSSRNILNFINDFFASLNFEAKHSFPDFHYMPLNALSDKAVDRDPAVEFGLFPFIIDKRVENGDSGQYARSRGVEAVKTENSDGKAPVESPADVDCNDEMENGSGDFEAGQFDFIARRAAALCESGEYGFGDMMVLLTRMSAVDSLAFAFREAGVPFVITKSRKFYERPEVLDMYNLVRSLADPYDDISLCGILRSPVFSVPDYLLLALKESFYLYSNQDGSDSRAHVSGGYPHSEGPYLFDALEALAAGGFDFYSALDSNIVSNAVYEYEKSRLINILSKMKEYTDLCGHKSAYDVLAYIYIDLNLECRYSYAGDFGPAYKNIEKLLFHIQTDDYLPDSTIYDLADNFESAVDIGFNEEESQPESPGNAVKIMTVHQAKGLEEKVVFIPELELDFFKAIDVDIMVNADSDLAFHPGAFIRLNENSALKRYYDSVKKYEKIHELFEKKRLLYVAMTRSCEKLIMSAEFRITISSSGTVSSAVLKKQPFIFANCHLNWLVNYLNLDAHYFIDAMLDGEYRIINCAFGHAGLFVKPPEPIARSPRTDLSTFTPSGCSALEFIESPAHNSPGAVNEVKKNSSLPGLVKLSYSAYKKLFAAESEIAVSDSVFSANAVISSCGTVEKRDADDVLNEFIEPVCYNEDVFIGTMFHKALAMLLQTPFASGEASGFVKAAVCAAYKDSPDFPGLKYLRSVTGLSSAGVDSAAVRCAAALDSFIKNANACALSELFDRSSKIRKYCEFKLEYLYNERLLEGVCDLITIDYGGAAVIYDFKTVRSIAAAEKVFDEYATQLAFYQLCAQNSLAGVYMFKPPAVIVIENCGAYNVKKYDIPLEKIRAKQNDILKRLSS